MIEWTGLYKRGDAVKINVHDKYTGNRNWLPATVESVRDREVYCVRRGNKLERIGCIHLGFDGAGIDILGPNMIRHAQPSSPPATDSLELEKRAMRSAVAWYVEYMERERDGVSA